jgi:hypothetical protein
MRAAGKKVRSRAASPRATLRCTCCAELSSSERYVRARYARSDDRRLVVHLQVSYDQVCTTCDSDVYYLMCPNCVTGTKICTHSKKLQDCKECNGLGKVVYRGMLCNAHGKRRSKCKTCRDAELAGEKCSFGKRDGRAE